MDNRNRVSEYCPGLLVNLILFHLTNKVRTYPSAFVVWPSTYMWSGFSYMTSPTPTCTAGTWTETVSGNPQPSNASEMTPLMALFDNDLEEDPDGLTYFLATAFMGYWQWATMSELWPDQAPLTTCVDNDIGPNWAAFTATNWYTATSTRYTSTSSSLAIPKEPSSTSTIQPFQSPTTSATLETKTVSVRFHPIPSISLCYNMS